MRMLRDLSPGCPRRPEVRRIGPGSALLLAIAGVFALSCGTTPVGLSPVITLSPSKLSFTAIQGGGHPPSQTISITSGGGGALTGLVVGAISYGAGEPTGWLVGTLGSNSAPAILTLTVTTGSLVAGKYTAFAPVISSVAANSPLNVEVTFVVSTPGAPVIALTPSSVSFSAAQFGSNPAPQTISVTNVGSGTLSGLAADSITYGIGPAGWLVVSLSGSTAPATLTLSVTTGTLGPGTYSASVLVRSTVATNSAQTVGVTFVVGPPTTPVIALTPSGDFNAMENGPIPAAQTISVTNGGGGTLNGLAVGTVTYGPGQATGWLGVSMNGTAAPTTLTVSVTTTSLVPGTYTATVPVTSSVASNSPQTVGVRFVVTGPPAIGLTPGSVRFGAIPGGTNPATQTVIIKNCGGQSLSGLAVGTITYGAGQPTGWLGDSLSATTAPATLTLSATTGSLGTGTYTATVPVTSSVANNSPQTLGVTFVVDPAAPAIALTPASANFFALHGYDTGDSLTINVTNGGGGTLSELAVGTITIGCGQVSGQFSASLSGSTAPATLKVRVGVGFRTPRGTYTATLPVTSSVATNSPQYVTLTLTVQ